MNRTIDVNSDAGTIGTLHENAGTWSFHYSDSWLSDPNAFDLSPSLSRRKEPYEDNASHRPVQWFFDNLLPENDLRIAIANASGIPADDAWALLEHFGKESFGSISLGESKDGGISELTFKELEKRIKNLPRIPISSDSPKKMSLAGAQHKLLAIFDDGKLYEPIGKTVSTHILKPNHPGEDYPDSVINEYFCMKLAERIGLNAPEVKILRTPSPVYLIKRFDRVNKDGTVKRIHAIDGAQMLSMNGLMKYQAITADNLLACTDICAAKAMARRDVFRWSVFNVLIGNADAHLKNISFFSTRAGFHLAPVYDLVSTASYATPESGANERWPNVPLSMRIGNATHFSNINAEDLILLGREIGIKDSLANNILNKMLRSVQREAPKLQEEIESMDDVLPSERRRIRFIVNMVINDMIKAITPKEPKRSIKP